MAAFKTNKNRRTVVMNRGKHFHEDELDSRPREEEAQAADDLEPEPEEGPAAQSEGGRDDAALEPIGEDPYKDYESQAAEEAAYIAEQASYLNTTPPKTIECPECGTDNPEEAVFCFKCGHSFEETEEARPDAQTPKKKPKKIGFFGRQKQKINVALAHRFPNKFKPRDTATKLSFIDAKDASQQVLNYEELYEDGFMKLQNGVYSVAIAFEDTSYSSAKEDDQLEIFGRYVDWLNSIGSEISVQLWMSSAQISAEKLESQLNLEEVDGDDRGNVFRRELQALVKSKLAARKKSMRKTRVFILTIEAKTHELAKQALDPTLEATHSFFTTLKVQDRVLTGQERIELIDSMTNPNRPRGLDTFKELDFYPGATTRDLVCPSYVTRHDDAMLDVSGSFAKTYFVRTWGSSTRDTLLAELLNMPCDSVVSVHAHAWPTDKTLQFINNRIFVINSEIERWVAEHTNVSLGRMPDAENAPTPLKKKKEEAERLLNEVESHDQSIFDFTLTVTLMANSKKELGQGCEALENVARKHGLEIRGDWVEHRLALFATALPLGNPTLGLSKPDPDFAALHGPFSRMMLTDNFANLIPFTSVNMLDDGGMYLGINRDTRDFVIYDFDAHDTPNAFSLGMPRSGKSTNVKDIAMQMRLTYPDADIIVIDPEREYLNIARELGGQVVDISETSDDHVNLFDLSEYYSSEDRTRAGTDPLLLKVPFIQSCMHMMARNISDEEMNVIDQVCGVIYQKYLETGDSADIPTLQDFYDQLLATTGSLKEDAQHLSVLLRRYVKGSASVFNHETNVDLENKFVVFDIQSLSNQLKPLALLVILDHVWTRVTRNRSEGRRTVVLIDELQLILDDEYAVDFLDRLWTRSGKWGCLLHGITQNVDRLLKTEKTYYMVQNSGLLMLYKQSPASARSLAELLNLSDSQRSSLEFAQPGEGLYVFDTNKVIAFDNRIPREICPELYRTITTRFTDIVAYKREEAARGD